LDMANYRRFHAKGATYFFTVSLADRGRETLTENIEVVAGIRTSC